jgi:non-ribosomal peptide synthetase component F
VAGVCAILGDGSELTRREAGPAGTGARHPVPEDDAWIIFTSGPVRIGLPLDGWRLAVADPVTGQPVPWGEVGELVIGGVGVARYLDAERDAIAFRPMEA